MSPVFALVLAPSFENGTDVWLSHLGVTFADLNIPEISSNICWQMAFLLGGSHTNITICY